MKIDPFWEQILQAIEPEIKELRKMLDEPRYPAVLSKHNRVWKVLIDVEWPDGWAYAEKNDKFETQLNWTIKQLENWSDVRRMSYDTWHFRFKKDAEKFVMLYRLKWEV